MKAQIQIKLFATLQQFSPPSADSYGIQQGMSIRSLLKELDIPETRVRLIFIDGLRAELSSTLKGGERVGIFPPVGGG
jgi:molybdopterin converting factor small subunit